MAPRSKTETTPDSDLVYKAHLCSSTSTCRSGSGALRRRMLGNMRGSALWWHTFRHRRCRHVSDEEYSISYRASSSPAKKMRPPSVLAMSLATTSSVVQL